MPAPPASLSTRLSNRRPAAWPGGEHPSFGGSGALLQLPAATCEVIDWSFRRLTRKCQASGRRYRNSLTHSVACL
jgi:hypothetical protein